MINDKVATIGEKIELELKRDASFSVAKFKFSAYRMGVIVGMSERSC
jgi:hypothetical protein